MEHVFRRRFSQFFVLFFGLFIFLPEDGEVDVPFGVRLEIGEQRIGRKDGCIDVLQDRRFDGCNDLIHVVHRGIHARDGGLDIRLSDVRYDRIKIGDSGIGIVDDTRYLVVHHALEIRRDGCEVTGHTVHVGQLAFNMVAFDLSAQVSHERIHVVYRLIYVLNSLIDVCEEFRL